MEKKKKRRGCTLETRQLGEDDCRRGVEDQRVRSRLRGINTERGAKPSAGAKFCTKSNGPPRLGTTLIANQNWGWCRPTLQQQHGVFAVSPLTWF